VTWLDRLISILRPRPRPVILPGPPPPPPRPPVPDPAGAAAGLLAATNRARAAAGLPALGADPRLDRTAQGQAEDCARMGKLTHTGSDGSNPWGRMTAAGVKYMSASENAAWGQTSAEEVVRDWLADPPHAANVLSRAFTHMGGGCAAGRDGRLYWVSDYIQVSL
jgi:uncharacterized protein YkwD